MKSRVLKTLLVCFCLACCVGSVLSAQAQGHPQGMPPGGGHGPGIPPGGVNGGGNGAGNGAGNASGRGAAPNVSQPSNVTTPTGIKLGPPGRWWDDKTFAQTIGISKVQQKKMDAIVDANRSAIVATYKTFEKDKAALDALSKDPNADKTKLFAAIDAVNQARAALQKANTEMLLQIRQELDAAQVEKLEKLP